MPGIDLSQISSNWKKLQASLSSDGKSTEDKKRKTPHHSEQLDTYALKRKRQLLQPSSRAVASSKPHVIPSHRSKSRRSSTMGTSTSSPAPAAPTKTLLEDHNLTPSDLAAAYGTSSHHPASSTIPLALPSDAPNAGLHPTHKAGKFIALDCEMVGTGPPPATDSLLARVSIVNYQYEQLYDAYVQPPPGIRVTDHRTAISGIQPAHLLPTIARPFAQAQREVADLLHGRVLIGHALRNDLAVLGFGHARRDVRDTSHWAAFRMHGGAPRLRDLAKRELGVEIQGGSHSSLEDARAAMGLFRKVKGEWEMDVRRKFGVPRGGGATQGGGRKGNAAKVVVGSEDEDEEDSEEEEDGWDLLDGEEDEVEEEEEAPTSGKTTQAKKKKKKGKKKKRTKRK